MGVGRPEALAETLAALLARGMPLETALLPFTANPARILRLERKGRIEDGADADLVVLDTEHRVRDVMARGRWHVRNGETLVRGTFEDGNS
jgi:beta-aspartyl-dipeptidase (metallo-type)